MYKVYPDNFDFQSYETEYIISQFFKVNTSNICDNCDFEIENQDIEKEKSLAD